MEAPCFPPAGHVSSAVPEMSVAEIRRALSKLREIWSHTTPESPLFVCDKLHNNNSIAEFAKEFVFGHHLKRHYKSVTQTGLQLRKQRNNAASSASIQARGAGGTGVGTGSATACTAGGLAVPGPKGDANDPFPFASTWFPRTQRGKRAFEEKVEAAATGSSSSFSFRPAKIAKE